MIQLTKDYIWTISVKSCITTGVKQNPIYSQDDTIDTKTPRNIKYYCRTHLPTTSVNYMLAKALQYSVSELQKEIELLEC